ncbi:hypothetical protein [Streptomyces sp. P9-A4]|uniref:hypothetical protein n=1 Tax=Streptomyces sp. P9-A4 TaxID=3072285 RepID=UPI002FC75BF8
MNLQEAIGRAERKAHDPARPGRYAVSAMPAGAYIGIGEVLPLVAVSPFVAEHAAATRLGRPDPVPGEGGRSADSSHE